MNSYPKYFNLGQKLNLLFEGLKADFTTPFKVDVTNKNNVIINLY